MNFTQNSTLVAPPFVHPNTILDKFPIPLRLQPPPGLPPLLHRNNQSTRRLIFWAINPPRAASPFATVALLAAHEEPVQGTRIERRAILCTKQPENEGTSCPPCAQDKAGSDARGTKKRVYAFHQAQKEALPSHGSRAG